MQVGEEPSDGSFEQFMAKVAAGSKLDQSKLARGEITLSGYRGHKLTLIHNRQNDLPKVFRDEQLYRWDENFDIYKPVDADGPISLGWRSGALCVRAGGLTFRCTVTAEGKTEFHQTAAN